MTKQKFKLPDIKVQNTLGIRLVNKSISITSLLIIAFIIAAVFVASIYTIDITVEGSGVLEPSNIEKIYCEESGILKEVLFSTGEQINKGDLLAVFDTLSVYNQMQKKITQLKELRLSKLETEKKLPYERARYINLVDEAKTGIIEADLIMRERLVEFYPGEKRDSILREYKIGKHISMDKAYIQKLRAETSLKNAELELEKNQLTKFDIDKLDIKIDDLRNEIEYMETVLKHYKVFAKSDGKILTEDVDKMMGQVFNKGELLFEYSNMESWVVSIYIPEIEIHNISIGDSVKLEINALNLNNENKLYGGYVAYVAIDNSPSKVNPEQNNMYKAKVKLDLADMEKEEIDKLRRGYTVKANIITDSGTIGRLLIKYFRKLL